jgi:hypothetical protein
MVHGVPKLAGPQIGSNNYAQAASAKTTERAHDSDFAGSSAFFGTENVRIQAWMKGVLSFLVFSGLLVITARRACGRWSNLALV